MSDPKDNGRDLNEQNRASEPPRSAPSLAETISSESPKSQPVRELPVEKLRWICNPNDFIFDCTSDITPLVGFVGQERALKAIEFGLAIERPGYNIFVTGLTGTGRSSVIKSYLQEVAQRQQMGSLDRRGLFDWCFAYNTAEPDRPRILRLPAGGGKGLRQNMDEMVTALRTDLTSAFSSEEYAISRKDIVEAGQARQRQLFRDLETESTQAGFNFQISQTGVALIPLNAETHRPIPQEEFALLSSEERQEFENRRQPLWSRVQETFEKVRVFEREVAESVQRLEQETAEFAISRPFNNLLAEVRSTEVIRYIEEIRAYTLANLDLFREADGDSQKSAISGRSAVPGFNRDPFIAYRVNIFVDNSQSSGPPVIIETNPTWTNLFGKIERRAMMGAYFSDHTMLKPGSLALANGGYLVVNIRELLLNPGVWEALKRSLRNKEVRLEDPAEALGMLAPQGLRPQAVPLEVKVIVTGDDSLYHLLSRMDEDFWEIFKVKADFDFQIDLKSEFVEAYAAFVCSTVQAEKLRHFSRSGVARLVEHGARMVDNQGKLSTRFGQLRDIVVEADYWASREDVELVEDRHVRKAIEEKIFRSNLIAERIKELIAKGTILVDVEGSVVGQVNGLAVFDLGDIAFGRPSRITARTYMGRSGIVNIEREARLSGSTHDKGMLILTGYFGWKYANDFPIALSASIAFEQSYGGVDGDSASSTELYALLSSLADLPILQGIAVTGSVNQKGDIQPIGGVNEKVEGFFEVCQAIGLTGEQGVIIPIQNVENLMLREDVIEAAKQGKFHVWAVRSIDEGIEILTGVPAGVRDSDGKYPEGSVHDRVQARLREIALGLTRFGGPGVERVERVVEAQNPAQDPEIRTGWGR